MKTNVVPDMLMSCFLLLFAVALIFHAETVGWANSTYPVTAAFLQFAILSTCGEAISTRIMAGGWSMHRPLARMAVWGLIGAWISLAFPYAAGGVDALAVAGLWPTDFRAFSISLWANLFSGYAIVMMLTQRWLSRVVDLGLQAPWHMFSDPDFPGWMKVVLLSLVIFWLPAHTVTFLLPDAWRVLFAAFLGLALGVILGLRPRSTP